MFIQTKLTTQAPWLNFSDHSADVLAVVNAQTITTYSYYQSQQLNEWLLILRQLRGTCWQFIKWRMMNGTLHSFSPNQIAHHSLLPSQTKSGAFTAAATCRPEKPRAKNLTLIYHCQTSLDACHLHHFFFPLVHKFHSLSFPNSLNLDHTVLHYLVSWKHWSF